MAVTPPRRLNLKLGALLVLVWLVATALVVVFRLPFLAARIALGLVAAVWAIHVARVVLFNRKI